MENSCGVCLSGELKMSSGIRTLMNTEILFDMSALPFLCIFRPDIALTLTSYTFRTNCLFQSFRQVSCSILDVHSINTHFITFKTSELLHRCIYLILIPGIRSIIYTFFHIKLCIGPRHQYQPEGQRPEGLIRGVIWEIVFIVIFIIYL